MKHLFLLLTGLLLSLSCVAERYFVSSTGSPVASGADWSQSVTLTVALKKAVSGDEVWVQQGVYMPELSEGRHSTFSIAAGVRMLGGFLGTETKPENRRSGVYSTLSGDVGTPGEVGDNLFTVVTMKSAGNNQSMLDGFIVEGGNSRNFKEGLTIGSSGGGLYIEAGDLLSSHLISNCVFASNRAHHGGAVLVDSGRPSFVKCIFKNNSADFYGGAVYNKGVTTVASPIFQECVFEENSSNSGAGMTNNGTNGSSSPLLLSCQFINNTSLMNGAAIYNVNNDNGETEPVLENCSFVGNDSILGDDVSDNGISMPTSDRARQNSGGSLSPVRR